MDKIEMPAITPDDEQVLNSSETVRLKHYKIEGKLAEKLKNGDYANRLNNYGEAYRYFYKDVFPRLYGYPYEQHTANTPNCDTYNKTRLSFSGKFANPSDVLVEIGPGSCHFIRKMSEFVRRAIAIDVAMYQDGRALPDNMEFLIYDGIHLPFQPNSINVFCSHHVIEHLHPEDARNQLCDIYKMLDHGGRLLLTTPNPVTGPHDISRGFDELSSCFHLKEYSSTELIGLLRSIGFKNISTYVYLKGKMVRCPSSLPIILESILSKFKHGLAQKLGRLKLISNLLNGITIVAIKN